jgi:hypothetical protein
MPELGLESGFIPLSDGADWLLALFVGMFGCFFLNELLL